MKNAFLSLALAGLLNLGCSSAPPVNPKATPENLPTTTEQSLSAEEMPNLVAPSSPEATNPLFFTKINQFLSNSRTLAKHIMRLHEEELGFDYRGFKIGIQLCSSPMPRNHQAFYFAESNITCLDPEFLDTVTFNAEELTYEKIAELIKKPLEPGNHLQNLAQTLSHELGHAYADHRSEKLGKGSWPNLDYLRSATEPWFHLINFLDTSLLGDHAYARKVIREYQSQHSVELTQFLLSRLIAEGIGEYVERVGLKEDVVFDSSFNGQGLEEFLLNDENDYGSLYLGGYHLVKPVLDEYGSEGLDYLITHPPESSGNLYQDALKYRAQAMQELEEG